MCVCVSVGKQTGGRASMCVCVCVCVRVCVCVCMHELDLISLVHNNIYCHKCHGSE